MTRGHSSNIGAVSVIGQVTGKVLDSFTLSKQCEGCDWWTNCLFRDDVSWYIKRARNLYFSLQLQDLLALGERSKIRSVKMSHNSFIFIMSLITLE